MSAAERILYYVNGSIPNWRVALALHEKGLPFTGRRLRVTGEQRETRSPAFLALNPGEAQGKEVLELQRATRFIPTKADNYQGIEKAARSAGLLK